MAVGAVLSAVGPVLAMGLGLATSRPTLAASPHRHGDLHRAYLHRGYARAVLHVRRSRFARYSPFAPASLPPLAGTDGLAIPPAAARFMGYPYNVPGYRYEYGDACLLRVGGPFGPGPSAGPCPFGLDRAF